MSSVRRTLFLFVVAAACGPALAAQAPARTAVTIDYVGVEGLYLAVGSQDGLAAGDTVPVFESAEATGPLGLLSFVSVAKRRSVALPVDAGFAAAAGTVIYVALDRVGPPTASPVSQPSAEAYRPPPAQHLEARVASASGRLSMDLDLRETHTSWSGTLFGDTRRRYATPTTRLALSVRDLPGGLEVRTSMRGAYRYAEGGLAAPTTSIRAYELSVAKRFERVPLQVLLGRFHNPYEGFGGYWDGGLLRLGGTTGPGVGIAVGFEPDRANEGFSTTIPKLSGFADMAARGRGWRYDTEVALNFLRPSGLAERRRVGWSQRVTLGRVTVSHRLRYDSTGDSTRWELGELRIRTGVRLGSGVSLRGTYGRTRPGSLSPLAPFSVPLREEASAGLAMTSRTVTLGAGVGRTRREGPWGTSVAANAGLRAGGVTFFTAGRYWSRTGWRSSSVAPGVTFDLRATRVRLGYGLYDTESPTTRLTSHSADLQLTAELSQALSISVRGGRQWGEQLRGTRLGLGIWRSF